MMDLVLLALLVLNSTALWPLNRWAMMRDARTECLGMVLTATLAIGAAAVSFAMGKPLLVGPALLWGAVAGIAYAVGFILIIFYCLKIGPVGPTVTINNMGLLGPVVLDLVLYSGGKAIAPLTWVGLLATFLALVLMGWGHQAQAGVAPVTRRWALWVVVGWGFSALSMGSQFLSSHYAPEAPFAFVVSMSVVAFVILSAVSAAKGHRHLRREEVIAGGVTGLMMVFGIPVTLILLTRLSAAVVFPVTVAGPAVLMLLIGHALLKERLSPMGWTASVLGVAGLVLLSLR
ncbi:MAG: EamA family transporter [Lentisphaerae bacterium]|nr:EamA family transporter [Lentisphaerota bacterium]